MSHTPGPWSVWTSNSYRRIGNDRTGTLVCEPVTQPDGHPDLHFRNGGFEGPDARLIVAAPDLLDALVSLRKRLLDCCEDPCAVWEAYDSFYRAIVDEAIAKATGAA